MLDIQNLNVSYGRYQALNDITLKVNYGETFGLIGLNGAGKTTLIKTILGLRSATSGEIKCLSKDGAPISQTEKKKAIAYLPERFEPPSFLTAIEFILFSASLYKQKPSMDLIERTARSFELDPSVLQRSVNTFSKGMRQKLGLIATILTECEFLILDEPMSGLDPKARVCVKDNIMALKAAGRTVFLSSHILSDMHEICDHVCVLHNKTIQFDGIPDELMRQFDALSLERAFLESIKEERLTA